MSKKCGKSKNWLNCTFCFAFLIGWFLEEEIRKLCVSIFTRKSNLEQCGCPRSVSYKSQSVFDDETNRWRLMTNKHQYEMINGEPRIGINGMWREELKEINEKATLFLKQNESTLGRNRMNWKLEEMYRRHNHFVGVDYLANYVDKISAKHRWVEIRRPYQSKIPLVLEVEHVTNDEWVNIVCPTFKVTQRFYTFMNNYERNILGDPNSGPIRLLFVIFRPINKNEDKKSTDKTVAVLDEFKQRNPGARIDYIFEEGEFNRAVGIHSGIKHCKDDEIILFLDVDLSITSGFITRIRRNTIRGKQVFFPITFSQFSPDLINKASEINDDVKTLGKNKMEINKETGFWINYAFGMAAMYKSDYFKVGGFKLDIKGWGGEDVDLFIKAVSNPDLDVMWTVDKDLIHIYHSRGCDPKLAPNQYAMCIGAWSDSIGTPLQLATLYLNSINEKL